MIRELIHFLLIISKVNVEIHQLSNRMQTARLVNFMYEKVRKYLMSSLNLCIRHTTGWRSSEYERVPFAINYVRKE